MRCSNCVRLLLFVCLVFGGCSSRKAAAAETASSEGNTDAKCERLQAMSATYAQEDAPRDLSGLVSIHEVDQKVFHRS